MQLALITLAVLQCCNISVTIRVPVVWDGDSEVTQYDEHKTSADKIQSENLQQPVPVEYFQYTAKKPQFAIDIANFHGVQSPEENFKARPVRPYTGKEKPELGRHKIQDPKRPVFQQFQEYLNRDENYVPHVTPASSNYEVFHPYKAEEPGLHELYKDPILDKIRNDIRDSQFLHTYENEAGKPNIENGEYLESFEETDRKKIPHRNVPASYEIHRPQRRPVYYRPVPRYSNRNHILNQRFKHPWNQNFVKIRPLHYVPLQTNLQRLRQHHALKYDDEHNEYPQVQLPQHYEQPSDGYDIYEKGKAKFVQLRNNLDESINNVAKESHPSAPSKLELQANEQSIPDEEDEFVPVKNYAQVRKIETTRHLPKTAAFDDAESYEEIKNAPRLREAVKSTKAQTVYTEEGYEDSAYDHAGEQKHASDHEAHAGLLHEKELSGGKYKTPSESASYEDGKGTVYRDQTLHGEKWQDQNKDSEIENNSEDYAEEEQEYSIEADAYRDGPISKNDNQRNKREDETDVKDDMEDEAEIIGDSVSDNGANDDDTSELKTEILNESKENSTQLKHDVNKRETIDIKVPDNNLNSTFFDKLEILQKDNEKIIAKDNLKEKYPYYFKNLRAVNKHSPLRYSENLKFIPKKSLGGTEFYDSRMRFECPEVDDNVDAIPVKLKKNGHPDEEEEEEMDSEKLNKGDSGEVRPRLSGLGDKIDCFKAKYFGKNPLDSPFFKEELISDPEPVIKPSLSTFKLNKPKKIFSLNSSSIRYNDKGSPFENLRNENEGEILTLLDKLTINKNKLKDSVANGTENLKSLLQPHNVLARNNSSYLQQSDVYTDILDNIKHNFNVTWSSVPNNTNDLKDNYTGKPSDKFNVSWSSVPNNTNDLKDKYTGKPSDTQSATYYSTVNIEITTLLPIQSRKKRAAAFVYEPYKIIREVQVPDSKKTTTTSNVSPLIKQLQSSKVIDASLKFSPDKDQPVKRTVNDRSYKDIGREEREKKTTKGNIDNTGTRFVNVNVDKRRGEPRYELRLTNHKPQYSPVDNKRAMTVEDYETQTKQKNISIFNEETEPYVETVENPNLKRPAPRALYDISRYLPKFEETHNSAASNTVKTTFTQSPAPTSSTSKELPDAVDESEEDYDEEYDDEDNDEVEEEDEKHHTTPTTPTTTTTTTTTTIKPIFRRKIRSTTTTEKEEEVTAEPPKLRLVTRFRTPRPLEKNRHNTEINHKTIKKFEETDEPAKYREKKKKSSKSTTVTDSKKYGNEDDMEKRREEIDALIGVKHDMDEYKPLYEKETKKIYQVKDTSQSDEEGSSKESEEELDDDDEEEEEEDGEEYDEDNDSEEEISTLESIMSNTEAPKRTLVRTTDAPPSTTETKISKVGAKPVVTRKKVEIHREIPGNKSLPHVSQFKQDIEEMEITKVMPDMPLGKKQHSKLELLDFYKDENLAKDINQLGGVEVFKGNLDLEKGPKHGGNYIRAPEGDVRVEEEIETATVLAPRRRRTKPPKDAVTSQTENKKQIELDDDSPNGNLHGGNLKSINDFKRSRSSSRSERLIELTTENSDIRAVHRGNLESVQDRGSGRGSSRSAKLIELNDDNDDDGNASSMHDRNFKSYGARSSRTGSDLHGGNYRSAKLVAEDNEKGETKTSKENRNSDPANEAKTNAAVLLNSYVQAAPILTTTPAFILDPSKRMYYYVD